MGITRYETLNESSKDIVDAVIPKIRTHFNIPSTLDAIPQDIMMRRWDCERKEHVKSELEDDPRNWGLGFLKDLLTISRMKEGKLDEFHADLRKKVEFRVAGGEAHPWVKLQDIKEIKEHYEHPERPLIPVDEPVEEYEEESEEELYELVEEEDAGSKKRGRPSAKVLKGKKLEKNVKAKPVNAKVRKGTVKRVRRLSNGEWERPEKGYQGYGQEEDSDYGGSHSKSVIEYVANVQDNTDDGTFAEMSLEEIQAHLEVQEAELKTKRLRLALIEAKKKVKKVVKTESVHESDRSRQPDPERTATSVRRPDYNEPGPEQHLKNTKVRKPVSSESSHEHPSEEGPSPVKSNSNTAYRNSGYTRNGNDGYEDEYDSRQYNRPVGGYDYADDSRPFYKPHAPEEYYGYHGEEKPVRKGNTTHAPSLSASRNGRNSASDYNTQYDRMGYQHHTESDNRTSHGRANLDRGTSYESYGRNDNMDRGTSYESYDQNDRVDHRAGYDGGDDGTQSQKDRNLVQ